MRAAIGEDRVNSTVRRTASTPPSQSTVTRAALVQAATSPTALAIIVAIGVALRVREYLANRSLWIDEAFLALNLLDRSPRDLFGNLDFNQAAPPGFLVLEDVAANVADSSELALRFVPLVAGILALGAFALLARAVLPPAAAVLATVLAAVADGLVAYSVEVKPYSLDVAATCVLLLMAVRALDRPTLWRAAALGASGIAALTLSFASVFVVAAVAVALLAHRQTPFRQRIVVFAPALVPWSLALLVVALTTATTTDQVKGSLEGSGLYVDHPLSLEWLRIYGTDQFAAIGIPRSGGGLLQWLGAVMIALGALHLYRRNRAQASLLILPIAFTWVAATLHLYPLTLRTTLFLVPTALLLLACGVIAFAGAVRRLIPRPAAITLTGFIALTLAVGPLERSTVSLIEPRTKEELRPALQFVAANWRRGDVLVLHYGAQHAFRYYMDCGCLDLGSTESTRIWPIQATSAPEQFSPPFRSLDATVSVVGRPERKSLSATDEAALDRPGRTWFVYSHVADEEERAFVIDGIRARLERTAERRAAIEVDGAGAYLYERD